MLYIIKETNPVTGHVKVRGVFLRAVEYTELLVSNTIIIRGKIIRLYNTQVGNNR